MTARRGRPRRAGGLEVWRKMYGDDVEDGLRSASRGGFHNEASLRYLDNALGALREGRWAGRWRRLDPDEIDITDDVDGRR